MLSLGGIMSDSITTSVQIEVPRRGFDEVEDLLLVGGSPQRFSFTECLLCYLR